MLQFKFSLCYVKEKTHFEEKKKTTELTQQIVTDLLLFIMANMYGRKHTNVFSHNRSKRNLLSPPFFFFGICDENPHTFKARFRGISHH